MSGKLVFLTPLYLHLRAKFAYALYDWHLAGSSYYYENTFLRVWKKHIILIWTNVPINSKTFALCSKLEDDLISVRLKNLHGLIESRKIRSNGYWIILQNKMGITCQIKYPSLRILDVIMSTLWEKIINKKILMVTVV